VPQGWATNYSNAQGQDRGKKTTYGIKVREDKPYVLNFQPAENHNQSLIDYQRT